MLSFDYQHFKLMHENDSFPVSFLRNYSFPNINTFGIADVFVEDHDYRNASIHFCDPDARGDFCSSSFNASNTSLRLPFNISCNLYNVRLIR